MSPSQSPSPVSVAVVGFLAATAVPLLVGVVGFGDPWSEALLTALATGTGVGVVFYLYYSTSAESNGDG